MVVWFRGTSPLPDNLDSRLIQFDLRQIEKRAHTTHVRRVGTVRTAVAAAMAEGRGIIIIFRNISEPEI